MGGTSGGIALTTFVFTKAELGADHLEISRGPVLLSLSKKPSTRQMAGFFSCK
jgi:phosphosulfolactate synthase (CoM biosynthesis protein A)